MGQKADLRDKKRMEYDVVKAEALKLWTGLQKKDYSML